jgi:hypothetical protein
MSIIYRSYPERLTVHQKKVGLNELAGFVSGRGTADDESPSMKIALQALRNANHDAEVMFVDLVKAFDRVNSELLFALLPLFGVPEKLIAVIRKLYTDVEFTTTPGKA